MVGYFSNKKSPIDLKYSFFFIILVLTKNSYSQNIESTVTNDPLIQITPQVQTNNISLIQVTNNLIFNFTENEIILITNYRKSVSLRTNHKVALIGEFGLGNFFSFYAAYKIFGIYFGLGIGYLYYNDEINSTSIHIIEPAIVLMKPISAFLFRMRIGMDFVSEKRFKTRGTTLAISPDILFIWKNICPGVSFPVIIGRRGTAITFSLGVGYKYMFTF